MTNVSGFSLSPRVFSSRCGVVSTNTRIIALNVMILQGYEGHARLKALVELSVCRVELPGNKLHRDKIR